MTFDTFVLLIVAIMNAATLYFTRRTEKNTNSMKDALVFKTGQAAYGEGHDAARLEGEARAKELLKRNAQ